MRAVSSPETSSNFYQTARRQIPEGSYLQSLNICLWKYNMNFKTWDTIAIAMTKSLGDVNGSGRGQF
jgi:hypothetical protein